MRAESGHNLVHYEVLDCTQLRNDGRPSCWPWIIERYANGECGLHVHIGLGAIENEAAHLGLCAVYQRRVFRRVELPLETDVDGVVVASQRGDGRERIAVLVNVR